MGAVISVLVATILARVLHREAVGNAKTITYLDNLVSVGANHERLIAMSERTNATFGTIETGTSTDILGIHVDVTRKKIKMADKFMTKHRGLLEEVLKMSSDKVMWTHMHLWKILGVLFRYIEIARRPIADLFALMQKIRKTARDLATEKSDWNDAVKIHHCELRQLQVLAQETLRHEEFDVTKTDDNEPNARDDILFTDASNQGLGYVHITNREITVGTRQWSEEAPIHELEAEALLMGLERVNQKKRIIILIDNQVLFHGLVKGRSNAVKVNRAAGEVARRTGATWVGWIPSAMNWADGPSRLKPWVLGETGAAESDLAPVKQWHSVPRAPRQKNRD
jgi:hypothetical protein